MVKFAVLERGEFLSRRLVGRFGPAVEAGREPELLIVGPGVPVGEELRCGGVLLPGYGQGGRVGVRARSAVSYGLSGRDTLTLSSRAGDRLWIAVQRELVRADGTVLERQELPVRMERGADPLHTLALAGAMLLLGAQPEELCKL